jgi:hypothetical protein
MKAPLQKLGAGAVLASLLALSIGCYPAYPSGSAYAPGYSQDAKGYDVPYGEPAPVPQEPAPARYGVDPGVVIAGAAAVGLLGYALGSHHHHGYYGGYYAPVPYGYGPGYGYGPHCYPY